MKAIELKKEETNNFGDLIRVFNLVNMENNEVLFSYTFLHHEGHHETFLYDLRLFKTMIKSFL